MAAGKADKNDQRNQEFVVLVMTKERLQKCNPKALSAKWDFKLLVILTQVTI